MGQIGPVSAIIQNAYNNIVRGENPEFLNYLTFIKTEDTEIKKLNMKCMFESE